MKIIKNEIRPVGFVTLELNETEIKTIINVFEELAFWHRSPLSYARPMKILGERGELYEALKEALQNNK